MILAYPLHPPVGGRLLDTLAVKLNLRSVVEPLWRFAPRPPARAYYVDEAGTLITGVRLDSVESLRSRLALSTIQAPAGRGGNAGEFRSTHHLRVAGTLAPVAALRGSARGEGHAAQ